MKTKKFLVPVLTLILVAVGFMIPAQAQDPEEISGDLVYWALWNEGEPQQMALAETIAAFEEAYPNVKVKITWAGREVLTKARSALLAGTQLDLVDQAADELNAALIKNGQALPLDDLLEEEAYGEKGVKFKDIFVPGILEPYKWKDQVVFIPYEIITSAFWYNQNLAAKYNITPPKTWSELMGICEKLKGEGMPCFAQDGTINFYNAYWFYWLAERIMGQGAWYATVIDTTGAAWDDPGWLEVARKVQEPKNKGYFMEGFEGSIWPAGQVAWSQGEAAFLLCGSWVPNETQKTALEDFVYRGFPFPEVEGGKGLITELESYLLGWLVPKDAKNPAAAKAFIKFAMQAEHQMKIVTMGQNMVARKEMPMPEVLPDMAGWFETVTSLHKPYDGVQAAFPTWWTTIFMPLDDKLIFGEIKPEDFIAQLKAKTIEYWVSPPAEEVPVR